MINGLWIILVLLGGRSALADPGTGCEAPGSARVVLQCVLANHPELTRATLERKEAGEQVKLARQIPNPELDARVGETTEVALLHTWELGGKRSARTHQAEARIGQAEAGFGGLRGELALKAALMLHRLRQIEEERQVLAETIATFNRQVRTLRSRVALTPEQEVSLSVFLLAQEDAELKESGLLGERDRLIGSLQLAMGTQASFDKRWLPGEPGPWPDLAPGVPAERESQSAGVLRARAELGLAQSELELARAGAWPDLKLGPFVERAEGASSSGYSFGLQLSLGLPLFHQNSGAKALAQAGVERAQVATALARRELLSERSIELAQYRRSVESLRRSRWHEQHQKRHGKLEALFQRGVVSIPLVIEAHRQVLELQKTSHELELQALEALYLIQKLDGRLPEAFL